MVRCIAHTPPLPLSSRCLPLRNPICTFRKWCMAHHVFLLRERLAHLEYLDAAIAHAEVEVRLLDERAATALLETIPGVDRRTAEVLVAEIGTDMSRFPSAQHLASWAGMCPRSPGQC